MKLNRPPGTLPALMRLGRHTTRRGLSLLGICLLAAVMGGPASWAGGIRQESSPATQVHRSQLAAFAVGNTTQTIAFAQPPDTKVGAPVTLSAPTSSGLQAAFTFITPAVCTVSGSAVTTVTAGVCAITASQGGDATYAPAPEVARSFQVTTGQATQTITFTPPAGTTAGVPVSMSAPTSSGLEATFTSSTPAVCMVSGSTVQTVTSGTCIITASQGGSATYAAAAGVTQSFKVTTGPNSQTISFTPPPEVVQSGVPVGERLDS